MGCETSHLGSKNGIYKLMCPKMVGPKNHPRILKQNTKTIEKGQFISENRQKSILWLGNSFHRSSTWFPIFEREYRYPGEPTPPHCSEHQPPAAGVRRTRSWCPREDADIRPNIQEFLNLGDHVSSPT